MRYDAMKNNKNKELINKLEREIWLFQQWLNAIDDQQNDTQQRIQAAYQECISARKHQLDELYQQDLLEEA